MSCFKQFRDEVALDDDFAAFLSVDFDAMDEDEFDFMVERLAEVATRRVESV